MAEVLSFHETVYLWRKARGLTQGELARQAQISRPNLTMMERGGREVTLGTLRRIAKALQVRPGILADGIPPESGLKKRLTRGNLDRVARFLLGEKVRLSPREQKVAGLIRSCAKRKLGRPEAYGRILPRTSREEKYGWEQLKAAIGAPEIKNLLSRIDKRSLLP